MNAWIFSWRCSGREGAADLYRCGIFFIISRYSAFVPRHRMRFRRRPRVRHLSPSCVHPPELHLSVTSPLTLPLSFPLPSGTGATAWMRCWVHGNWVGIDWTAAWPTRGQWEPGGSEQHHWLRLSSPILQENINAVPLEASENQRTLHFLDNISTPCSLTCISAISSDWKSFLQHWLYHLTDWLHHLSGADCHISLRCHRWRLSCHVGVPGQRGTDVDVFAKEEEVIALSACWTLLFFPSVLPAMKGKV